jgi:hypothetical protein
MINTFYTYGWQVYPSSLQARNMLSQIYEVTQSKPPLGYFQGSLFRYNESFTCTTCQGSVPVPYDQYTWHGTGTPSSPPTSISTTPQSDWVLDGIVSQRDAYNGVEIETQGRGAQVNSQIWDAKKRYVTARVANSKVALCAYSSFEDASQGNWTWGSDCTSVTGASKTGNSYLNLGTTGVTKSGLNSSDTYVVTFWAQTSGGSVNISGVSGAQALGSLSSWTLFKFSVTNLTSFTLSLSGSTPVYIDELRILPSYAQMSTATFHPLFGPTSQTDANNISSFRIYDALGRAVNTIDEKGNITGNVIYNSQK